MSEKTWTRIEAGQSVSRLSYAGVEQTLHWPPGSCARVLAGDADSVERVEPPEPVVEMLPVDDPTIKALVVRAEALTPEQREQLLEIAFVLMRRATSRNGPTGS